ncbi:MAG: hypothetical protein ACREM6_09490 [Vulcanimicrobiaceae bacterium]
MYEAPQVFVTYDVEDVLGEAETQGSGAGGGGSSSGGGWWCWF